MPETNKVQWVFDPAPPSGSRHSGIPTSFLFEGNIETFVREVLQNSGDQRREDVDTVRVRFTVQDLVGGRLDDFLNATGWTTLLPHVQSMTGERYRTVRGRIREGLESLDSGKLRILRIDDFGTHGLNGDEDDHDSNFNALCRDMLETTEDRPGQGRGTRGGSYGLGKSVLLSFSSFSTVLFSSRTSETRRGELRLFGRTELPSHECLDGKWNGPGFFGQREPVDNGDRARSIWGSDAESIAQNSHLHRNDEDGTGTSILVIGFSEPDEENQPDLESLVGSITTATGKWFWPSMVGDPPRLTVEAVALNQDGSVLLTETAEPEEGVRQFVFAATSEDFVEMIEEPGSTANRRLDVSVPQKLSESRGMSASSARLRIRRISGDQTPEQLRNSVALVRGAGMVVKYRKLGRTGLLDYPVCGVLEVGEAAGLSPDHVHADEFFKSAEPHAHDDWIATTEQIRGEYKRGAGASLQRLWSAIEDAVTSVAGAENREDDRGPTDLERLFLLGGTAGGEGHQREFVSHGELQAFFNGVNWEISGGVRRRVRRREPWIARIRASVLEESGTGEPLKLGDITANGGTASIEDNGDYAQVEVPAEKTQVEFVVHSRADSQSFGVLSRSQVQVFTSGQFTTEGAHS